jgi:hypothetical protein
VESGLGVRPKMSVKGSLAAIFAIALLAAVLWVPGLMTSAGAVGTLGGSEQQVQPADQANLPWDIVYSPNSSSTQNELSGVSCVSTTFCVAVGFEFASPTTPSLIESWNGSTWSVVPSPDVGKSGGMLESVSCTSVTSCMAVGSYWDQQLLIESWDGVTWSISPPSSPGPESGLSSVSCTSPIDCVAVGSYTPPGSAYQTLVESWDGSSWSVIPSPNVDSSTTSNSLDHVSCSDPNSCLAMGVSEGQVASQPLVEHWDGTTWTVVASPSGTTGYSAVSCTSSTFCMAVGNGPTAPYETVAATWDGESWTPVPSQNPGSVFSQVLGVSCESATDCVLVGDYSNGSGPHTLVETWDGTNWAVTTSANPTLATTSVPLYGVSCVTATDCAAVGDYAHNGRIYTLSESPFGITTTSLPSGTVGEYYSATLEAVGGSPPYTWKMLRSLGGLPRGVKVNKNGTITGVPLRWAGTSVFTVEVLDARQGHRTPRSTAAAQLSINFAPGP